MSIKVMASSKQQPTKLTGADGTLNKEEKTEAFNTSIFNSDDRFWGARTPELEDPDFTSVVSGIVREQLY